MKNNSINTSELVKLFDADFDNGILYWKKREDCLFVSKKSAKIWNTRFAGKEALVSTHKDGYKCGLINKKPYLAHRVIFALRNGFWPEFVDHINGKRDDNRIENLRSVTKIQNSCNAKIPRTNSSGHIGVSWNKRDKKWTAYITLNKKRKALGNFDHIEDAIHCRKINEKTLGFHPNHGRKL